MAKDEYSLADLKAQASKRLNHRKETYAYARSKGFSAEEANVLASKSRDTIDRLATEREKEDSK
ncbi:MAG: hypothetical protein WC455_15565 [Dehalococcoidia bacterium]|jgi:hypothetical protein